MVPFFDEQGINLQRILINRGNEYSADRRGKPENHAYHLYLAVEDIDHSRTKANHPQTNGISERFRKTVDDVCYSLLFRKKLHYSVEKYNKERPHSGRYFYGKTPWEIFQQSRHLALAGPKPRR